MLDLSNYAFNLHAIPILITGVITLGLGLLTYFSNRAAAANRHFLMLSTSTSVWLCATGAGLLSRDPELALRWFKLDNVGVMYISVAFYAFSMEFLELRRPRSIRLGYALASMLAILVLFTDKFVTGVYEHWWGYYPKWGVYSFLFLFVFFSYMSAAFMAFLKSYWNRSSPIKHNQIKYVLIAFLIGYAGSVDFVPTFGYPLYPFGYIPVFILLSVITYTILRHRLMDVSIVINKGLAYGLLLGLLFVPTYLFVIISQRATFYSIPPLLAGSLIFACGLWIALKNPKSVTNISFGLVCLGVCIWLFSVFMMYSTMDGKQALFWGKFVYLGVVYIPAFFYHFCVNFLQRKGREKQILANYVISTLFLSLVPTNYFLNGQYFYFWGYYPAAGMLHPVFLGYFAWVSGRSLYKLYLGYKAKQKVEPPEATRIKYVFWAFVIGYAASIDFIQNYGVGLYPIGQIFVSLWALIVTYAIAKYQVLDISLIITKAKILRYAQVLTPIPLYFIVLTLIRAFTGSMDYFLAGILVATFTIAAGLLVNLQKLMEKTVGKTLFRKRYDAYETLQEFSTAMVTILDLETLKKKIIETLSHVMGIAKASLFLLDKEKDTYFLAAAHEVHDERIRRVKIQTQDPLPQHLRKTGQPIVKEELEHHASGFTEKEARAISDALVLIESELCIPLINKDRLIGFLNLGHKTNREMYSQEDLNLLSTLAQNAAISLDNALLYEDFKRQQSLMRRTDRLRSLETMAGGFAHEIRNPLTSIKTFIQLALERKDDPEFMGAFSKMASEDMLRIERLIQEILDYARYMEPQFTEEDLNEVVESSLYFVGVKADEKEIQIEKDLAGSLPTVMVDRQQIKQVLLNLFLNALDAMPNGGRLTVKTHQLSKNDGGPWAQIEVADTGHGIPEADLEHIFDPFFTTKHESKEREGTGLGLTIVHEIVQEHRGYIDVESKPGVGTTFYINLPVNPILHERRRQKKETPSG